MGVPDYLAGGGCQRRNIGSSAAPAKQYSHLLPATARKRKAARPDPCATPCAAAGEAAPGRDRGVETASSWGGWCGGVELGAEWVESRCFRVRQEEMVQDREIGRGRARTREAEGEEARDR
jgi:hypothetical protein